MCSNSQNYYGANGSLSPAAQAVKRDIAQIMQELSQRCRVSISATDTLPITLETNDTSLEAGINALCAAALRAAADQVVPEPDDAAKETFSIAALRHRWQIRDQFLAIAAELEGAPRDPLEPNDLSHLSDEEFQALAPQGFHGV